MMNLYIDFDGVILNTIPIIYKKAEEAGVKLSKGYNPFIGGMDWHSLISECEILEDSINCIKKIINSKKFDVSILTHVNSLKEAEEKILWIENKLPDITVIPVPKVISKTKMVHVKDAILVDDYLENVIDWENKGGIGIKFSITGNSKGYKFVTKLDQLIEMF